MTELRFEHNGTEVVITAERTERGWRVRLPGGTTYEVGGVASDGPAGAVGAAGCERVAFSAAALDGEGARGPERRLSLPSVQSGQTIGLSWRGRTYLFGPRRATGRQRGRPKRVAA